MQNIIYKEYVKPKLKNPVFIEGLPGFGQVGRLAAEHLVKELKAVKFGELLCTSFPPEVFIEKDGIVKLIKNEFFYSKKANVIILVGDSQSTDVRGQYELSDAILDVAGKYGTKLVFTLGGYATGVLKETPSVFGAATSKELIKKYEKYGIIFRTETERGSIVGASGLIIGLAPLRDMGGICLMGETPGHPLFVDAKSAEAVLAILGKILGVKIDMKELEERAKEIEKFRTTVQQMMQKASKGAHEKEKAAIQEQLRYIG